MLLVMANDGETKHNAVIRVHPEHAEYVAGLPEH